MPLWAPVFPKDPNDRREQIPKMDLEYHKVIHGPRNSITLPDLQCIIQLKGQQVQDKDVTSAVHRKQKGKKGKDKNSSKEPKLHIASHSQ